MDAWRGEAVIFDCDGTLVDVSSIRHHVVLSHPENRGFKDFRAFHRASVWCPPIAATLAAYRLERAVGRGILVMTARMRQWEAHTRGWLATQGIEFDALYMRRDGDQRPDSAVKAEMLHQARMQGWDVVAAYDDNPSIVKLWQMEGLDVTVVPGWID